MARLIAYGLLTLALMPVQALAVAFRWRLSERLPVVYHRLCCRILGLKVRVIGEVAQDRPLLFVSNHVSYLDIPVLSTVVPLSFVAKSEVATWPVFGQLAKLQRTVFVDRRRASTSAQRDAIQKRLDEGGRLVLFPEGTSNDGTRVLSFKSALLSVAAREVDGRPLTVQPVTIAYTLLDGIPAGRAFRPFFAWHGDMELGAHLWRFAGLGETTVDVRFHKPLAAADFENRRALTRATETVVSTGLETSLAGREKVPAIGQENTVDP